MKKHSNKNASEIDKITAASDFNEAKFEKEYFPEGSFDEAMEKGLVKVSDSKGNWHKAETSIKITLNISPVIRRRAESLDAHLSMGYQNVLKAAMLLGIKELETKEPS